MLISNFSQIRISDLKIRLSIFYYIDPQVQLVYVLATAAAFDVWE